MAKLMNKINNSVIIENLIVADTFMKRLVGLLSHESLSANEAMWIQKCNSIHTCFMRFSIDCIFLDKSMTVRKIFSDVKPWRITSPVWVANSVIEMQAGRALFLNLKEGDVLHVES